MNTLLLYILTVLLPFKQTDARTVTKTYKFERTYNNELLTDYIQLVFKGTTIIKGMYYWNDNRIEKDDYHFVANMLFEENSKDGFISFYLVDPKFCRENSSPFVKNKFHKLDKSSSIFCEEHAIHILGTVENTELNLHSAFSWYDSRTDHMPFVLIKEE